MGMVLENVGLERLKVMGKVVTALLISGTSIALATHQEIISYIYVVHKGQRRASVQVVLDKADGGQILFGQVGCCTLCLSISQT